MSELVDLMKLGAVGDSLMRAAVQAPADFLPRVLGRLAALNAQLDVAQVAARRASFLRAPVDGLGKALGGVPRPVGSSPTFGGRNGFRTAGGPGGDVVALLLRADIGFGTSAESLFGIENARQVIVGLDLLGGCGVEAQRMYSVLRQHPRVTTVVVGSCCSAAVDVLQAGRVRLAHRASVLMIHTPQICALGSARRLREAADLVERAHAPMSEFFQCHTGQPADVVESWLDGDDHYFSADEAKAAGLIDQVFDDFGTFPQKWFAEEVAPAADGQRIFPVQPKKGDPMSSHSVDSHPAGPSGHRPGLHFPHSMHVGCPGPS